MTTVFLCFSCVRSLSWLGGRFSRRVTINHDFLFRLFSFFCCRLLSRLLIFFLYLRKLLIELDPSSATKSATKFFTAGTALGMLCFSWAGIISLTGNGIIFGFCRHFSSNNFLFFSLTHLRISYFSISTIGFPLNNFFSKSGNPFIVIFPSLS